MRTSLKKLFARTLSSNSRPTVRRADLQLETLEERRVMSVTFHGGSVLPHVDVVPLFYGPGWITDPQAANQVSYLEGSLENLVQSPYMDMLTRAGYGVGRGGVESGEFIPDTINGSPSLSQSTLQGDLQDWISKYRVVQPDGANTLYVIYVEPNQELAAFGQTSGTEANIAKHFYAYHESFAGQDYYGNNVNVRYAVIAYPGGVNAQASWLSTADQMTEATSHEVAEAVTDPDLSAWYSNSSGEIGDISANSVVYERGYAVQRIADKGEQPMTPADATASQPVTFVLQETDHILVRRFTTGNELYERTPDGVLSPVLINGVSGIQDAKAGQGVSYVLYSNGNFSEYKDSTGSLTNLTPWWFNINAQAIDAGTDLQGVNILVINGSPSTWELSDDYSWHYIADNISKVSAGRNGNLGYVDAGGDGWWWNEAGQWFDFASGVAKVTVGYNTDGQYMIDALFSNGSLQECLLDQGGNWNWSQLDGGVTNISKARAGAVDDVESDGNAVEFTAPGDYFFVSQATGSIVITGRTVAVEVA
jgi:hypothetical protein